VWDTDAGPVLLTHFQVHDEPSTAAMDRVIFLEDVESEVNYFCVRTKHGLCRGRASELADGVLRAGASAQGVTVIAHPLAE
jgi:hypothetical protein